MLRSFADRPYIDREPGGLSSFCTSSCRPSIIWLFPEYGGQPIVTIGHERYYGTSSLERVITIEQLAAGDAGRFLGGPGPSMSSIVMIDLGDEEQRNAFIAIS